MHATRRLVGAVAVAALFLLAAGCSEDAGQASTGAASVANGDQATTASSASTVAPSTTGTTAGTAPTDPGDVTGDGSGIGPPAGERLDVVSVAFDDVLNFRTQPEPSAPIVDTVAPRSNRPIVISAGDGTQLERSVWWRVTVGGAEAWANLTFLGILGRTEEYLDQLIDLLGTHRAGSIDELVAAIVDARSTADGSDPRVTFVTEPQRLPNGADQVIVDIAGSGDDSVKGDRVTLLVEPVPASSGTAVRLIGATRTLICSRGVSDGRCS